MFEEDGGIRAVDHEQIALEEKEIERDEPEQTIASAAAATSAATAAAEAKELGYEPGDDSKGWYCSSS